MIKKSNKTIQLTRMHLFWSFGYLNFEFVSNFDIRVSDLVIK